MVADGKKGALEYKVLSELSRSVLNPVVVEITNTTAGRRLPDKLKLKKETTPCGKLTVEFGRSYGRRALVCGTEILRGCRASLQLKGGVGGGNGLGRGGKYGIRKRLHCGKRISGVDGNEANTDVDETSLAAGDKTNIGVGVKAFSQQHQ